MYPSWEYIAVNLSEDIRLIDFGVYAGLEYYHQIRIFI